MSELRFIRKEGMPKFDMNTPIGVKLPPTYYNILQQRNKDGEWEDVPVITEPPKE